ncbi:Restriction endonuclease [Spirosoma endophyticum]|uniref:Restriction endonuclease n=1 Tax=Spirosoma endophyticum TaxID=662367 RepID=A0A1I1W2Y3_9BACT|nr:Restriction endonuclease [Spirosoma endophyticum]
MKFIVSSSVLLKNLQLINGVVGTNPIVPILENFLFRIEDGIIDVRVDDLNPAKLSPSGITAVILINELNRKLHVDAVDELILEIYNNNKKIYSTHHYDFERIVRKLFIGLGYDVTPTKRTRDGGYDMVAINEGVIPTCHLIECKTRKKAPLGIELVERFLFKINELKASTGVMVTNLRFSADVIKKYATKSYQHYLKLIDGKELLSMVNSYVSTFLSYSL